MGNMAQAPVKRIRMAAGSGLSNHEPRRLQFTVEGVTYLTGMSGAKTLFR
jgi:hypothetical protein